MMSFRSRNYPRSTQTFMVMQEFAMRYYAIFALIVMIGVVLRVYYQREAVLFGFIGAAIAIFLGNILATVQAKRKIAEIFFVNDGLSVISVYDILHQTPKRSFPLRFANPTRNGDQIQFHFEDQIIEIKREDWDEDFDLIWNWLNQSHLDYVSGTM